MYHEPVSSYSYEADTAEKEATDRKWRRKSNPDFPVSIRVTFHQSPTTYDLFSV
jgi:hypothetical protein